MNHSLPHLLRKHVLHSHLSATLLLAGMATAAHAAGNHAGGHAGGHGSTQAIGQAGTAAQVTRTVHINMTDAMRFSPASISVKPGDTIKFVEKNSGKLKHEMVLGSEQELKEHAEEMKKNPEMEHADANQITLAPGQTGEIIWQFTQAGKVNFACLQPGHYEAGMKGAVTVAGKAVVHVAQAQAQGQMQGPGPTTSSAPMPAPVKAQAAPPAAQPVAAASSMTEGEIRRVNKEAQKLTIKHGEIKNLNMGAMTMVFQVKDPAMLEQVQAGDKVRFTAGQVGGAFTVLTLEKAAP